MYLSQRKVEELLDSNGKTKRRTDLNTPVSVPTDLHQVLWRSAGILNVRYETAESRTDFLCALDRLSDCDLVLIDTLGAYPRNRREVIDWQPSLSDCRRFGGRLSALQRLGLDAPVSPPRPRGKGGPEPRPSRGLGEAFKPLNFGSLFFTKLDECRHYGALVNTAITTPFHCHILPSVKQGRRFGHCDGRYSYELSSRRS